MTQLRPDDSPRTVDHSSEQAKAPSVPTGGESANQPTIDAATGGQDSEATGADEPSGTTEPLKALDAEADFHE